jgi:ribonuclease P protein component
VEIETLNKNMQFKRVYYRGKSIVSPVLVIYVLRTGADKNRIGITTSKKIGKSVVRNRARRVIKSAFSEIAGSLPVGYDIVLVARKRTAEMKSPQIRQVMKGNMKLLMKK